MTLHLGTPGAAARAGAFDAWRRANPGALPPYPDDAIIPMAATPRPPLLGALVGLPGPATAWALWGVLQGAAAAVGVHYTPLVDMRALLSRSWWPLLLDAADVMVRENIAPIAWCHWSLTEHKRLRAHAAADAGWWNETAEEAAKRTQWQTRSTAAPVGWVFAPSRLRERTAMFEWCSRLTVTRVVLMSSEHTALVQAWNAAEHAARQAFATSDPPLWGTAAVAAFERVLPPAAYTLAVAKARAANEAIGLELQHRVARNEWVWTNG